jgi:hypothetical protein
MQVQQECPDLDVINERMGEVEETVIVFLWSLVSLMCCGLLVV